MRGSIRELVKGRRYELRIALGKDPLTGKYRQKSITVRGTRAQANRELRRVLVDLENGSPAPTAPLRDRQRTVTFAELLEEWMTFKQAADRSPTTVDRYRRAIEIHLKPTLGAVPIGQLSPKSVPPGGCRATGARRGELCALRWTDVDLKAKRLTIERGIVVVDGGVVERPTKTDNVRVVAIDDGTIAALTAHRRRERRAEGLQPQGRDPTPRRNPSHRRGRRRAHRRRQARTCPRQRHLGYIYSHFLPERDREAADVLGSLLDRPIS